MSSGPEAVLDGRGNGHRELVGFQNLAPCSGQAKSNYRAAQARSAERVMAGRLTCRRNTANSCRSTTTSTASSSRSPLRTQSNSNSRTNDTYKNVNAITHRDGPSHQRKTSGQSTRMPFSAPDPVQETAHLSIATGVFRSTLFGLTPHTVATLFRVGVAVVASAFDRIVRA